MKTAHMLLIGAGAVGVGFLLLRSRPANAMSGNYLPAVNVQETVADQEARALAAVRSVAGAKATTSWSSGIKSVVAQVNAANNKGAARAAGKYADTLLPGSGSVVESVASSVSGKISSVGASAGSKVASAIKSLF